MYKKLLTSMQSSAVPFTVVPPKIPTNCQPRKEYPHCKKKHANQDKCWELEANKASRPENWKSTQTRALGGVQRMSPLSSGSRMRLKSIK